MARATVERGGRVRAHALGALVAIAGAAALLGGCTAPPARTLRAALEAVGRRARPMGLRLAVLPIAVDAAARKDPTSTQEAWRPLPVPTADLGEGLVAACRRSGAFSSVEPIRGAGPDAALEGARGLDAAFAAGADVALEGRVTRYAVRFVRHNQRFLPNLANFLLLGFPAWFVADERYRAEVDVEVTLRATATGRRLWQGRYRARPELDLDHFARGWSFFGVFTVPGSLTVENYRAAGKTVMPYARNRLLREVTASLAGLDAARLRRGARKALAVVVGADRVAGASPLEAAARDAERFAGLLRRSAGVSARTLVALAGPQATRAAVLAAIGEAARRARAGDHLYLFFAGYGFCDGGRAYLAMAGTDPARAAQTAVSVDEVRALLAGSRARQVIVLATSFVEPARQRTESRTLPIARRVGPLAASQTLRALRALAVGRTLLLATTPTRALARRSPLPDEDGGLFVARLGDRASDPATDRDRDGRVSLADVFDRARRDTLRLAARAGYRQAPSLLGRVPVDVVWRAATAGAPASTGAPR